MFLEQDLATRDELDGMKVMRTEDGSSTRTGACRTSVRNNHALVRVRVSAPVTAVENDGKVVTYEGVLQPTRSPQHPPDETIRYGVEGVTALRGSRAEAGFVRYRSNLTAYRTQNEVFTQSMSDMGPPGFEPESIGPEPTRITKLPHGPAGRKPQKQFHHK